MFDSGSVTSLFRIWEYAEMPSIVMPYEYAIPAIPMGIATPSASTFARSIPAILQLLKPPEQGPEQGQRLRLATQMSLVRALTSGKQIDWLVDCTGRPEIRNQLTQRPLLAKPKPSLNNKRFDRLIDPWLEHEARRRGVAEVFCSPLNEVEPVAAASTSTATIRSFTIKVGGREWSLVTRYALFMREFHGPEQDAANVERARYTGTANANVKQWLETVPWLFGINAS